MTVNNKETSLGNNKSQAKSWCFSTSEVKISCQTELQAFVNPLIYNYTLTVRLHGFLFIFVQIFLTKKEDLKRPR